MTFLPEIQRRFYGKSSAEDIGCNTEDWVSSVASVTNKGREVTLQPMHFTLCCLLFMKRPEIINDALSRASLTIWKNIHSRKSKRSVGEHGMRAQPCSSKLLL